MWAVQTVRLHSEAVTLMDTFKHEKVPEWKLEEGKREGAKSFRTWLAQRYALLGVVAWGAERGRREETDREILEPRQKTE